MSARERHTGAVGFPNRKDRWVLAESQRVAVYVVDHEANNYST